MYGYTHHHKQRYRGKDCQRQFVATKDHWIDAKTRQYIEGLLRERISLRAICRAMQVSMTWLMDFAASIWEQTPRDQGVDWDLLDNLTEKELQSVELQIDEIWSFAGRKRNKRWTWVIYRPAIKQVLALHIGGRGNADAQQLLDKLPQRIRTNCSFTTDYWEACYQTVLLDQHRASKALTNFIEGYFTSVRAGASRLVRRSPFFSKKLANHDAAIGYLLWQRNLTAHHYF